MCSYCSASSGFLVSFMRYFVCNFGIFAKRYYLCTVILTAEHYLPIQLRFMIMNLYGEQQISHARELFAEHLRLRHLRKTPERYAIMERAMEMKGHFSSDDLYARLEDEGYHVSRSTVYSTLELLCECGLIRQHLLSTRRAGYEVAHTNHCHMLCTRCRKVTEIEGDFLSDSIDRLDTGGFRPTYFSMTLYGICADCRREQDSALGKTAVRPADIQK